jgi:GTP cyclohydrolase I
MSQSLRPKKATTETKETILAMTAAEVKDDSEESLVNREKVEQAVRMILEAIGENPDREGLHDTPARVARMYEEIFSGLHRDPSEVLSARFHVDHDEVVLVKDIPFYSSCEHHLLPFFGEAHVAYLPRHGVVTGLSKLARLVDIVAKRPQIQERMTNIIADTLENDLDAVGVMVVIEAEHLCMTMRGIKKPGSKTVTMASRGAYEDSARQQEILRMLNLS